MTRVAAPLLPLVSEQVWQGLTGGRSVHLENWPSADEFPADVDLVAAMDQVRTVSSVSLSLRKTNGFRVRLPLSTLTVVTKQAAALQPFAEIIADELNVKAVKLVELSLDSTTEFGVIKRLNVNARAAGPRIGKSVQAAIQSAKAGDWSDVDGKVVAGGIELVEGEYEIDLVANFAGGADDKPSTDLIGILPTGGFVILDSSVTPELAAEGLARDVIRGVQQARKDADFDVSDRIRLSLTADEAVLAAVAAHEELVKGETLALELHTTEGVASAVAVGNGQFVDIVVVKL